MTKVTNTKSKQSMFKIIGLISIIIETTLLGGTIFGFASLFGVLPRYKIYESRCQIISEKTISNDTIPNSKNCRGQVDEYQLAMSLGIGFFNLPAVVIGMVSDFFGPRTLKLIGIVFNLISWISLGFLAPGYDWLLLCHTICSSIAGMCVLLSSFGIAADFTKTRGLVTSLVGGAQLGSCVWYAIFQVLIDKELVSLSTLAFIWASFSILMFINAMLFLNWHVKVPETSNKSKLPKVEDEVTNTPDDSLAQHLTHPIFISVTVFVSCFLLITAFLPMVWFPWVFHLTGQNLKLTNHLTSILSISSATGIFLAPLCGLVLDYKANRGYSQKLFNISVVQTATWCTKLILCLICMIRSIAAPIGALCVYLLSRTLLIAGSQSVISTVFPPAYIGTLLGVLWTTVGIISFATYGLTRLAANPEKVWKAWLVLLALVVLMIGHVVQLWFLYFKSKKQTKQSKEQEPSANEAELKDLKSSIDS